MVLWVLCVRLQCSRLAICGRTEQPEQVRRVHGFLQAHNGIFDRYMGGSITKRDSKFSSLGEAM